MPSNRDEIACFKEQLRLFMEATQPLLEKLEKRVDGCRNVTEKLLHKVAELDDLTKALRKKQELQEGLLEDMLVTQELLKVKLEVMEVKLGSTLRTNRWRRRLSTECASLFEGGA